MNGNTCMIFLEKLDYQCRIRNDKNITSKLDESELKKLDEIIEYYKNKIDELIKNESDKLEKMKPTIINVPDYDDRKKMVESLMTNIENLYSLIQYRYNINNFTIKLRQIVFDINKNVDVLLNNSVPQLKSYKNLIEIFKEFMEENKFVKNQMIDELCDILSIFLADTKKLDELKESYLEKFGVSDNNSETNDNPEADDEDSDDSEKQIIVSDNNSETNDNPEADDEDSDDSEKQIIESDKYKIIFIKK